jgi:hypothetical protein
MRHSTRISAPLMVTPRSAWGEAAFVEVSGVVVGVLMRNKRAAKVAAKPPQGKQGIGRVPSLG